MHELIVEMRRDRTQATNEAAAVAALGDPQLLAELFDARDGKDQPLAGDAADAITRVGNHQPESLLAYWDQILAGTQSKVTRVRWESVGSLARLTALQPAKVEPLLPDIERWIAFDPSVIVRDNAIDVLHRLGQTSERAASLVAAPLIVASTVFAGKHAARAIAALAELVPLVPGDRDRLGALAAQHLDHGRSSVKTAARRLIRAIERAS